MKKVINNDYKENYRRSIAIIFAKPQLTNWAENALMESEYEDDDKHTIRTALAQLGLSDVKAFGLEGKDCEAIMKSLGYKLEVKALEVG